MVKIKDFNIRVGSNNLGWSRDTNPSCPLHLLPMLLFFGLICFYRNGFSQCNSALPLHSAIFCYKYADVGAGEQENWGARAAGKV